MARKTQESSPGRREALPPFTSRLHPHLYQINTWVWLDHLSARLGRRIGLADVPDTEWDALRDLGFDYVYLMGIWRRSALGRRIFRTDKSGYGNFDAALPGWKMSDVVGSPYSIQDYTPDPHIGTFDDLDAVRQKLRQRGMGLILDFVPNHTGFDHPWVSQHPDYYIQGSEDDFRQNPAAFYLSDDDPTDPVFVARGKDPYFAPWSDVAQLNHFNPACRRDTIEVLSGISRHCDGVRCDMAMLVTNEVFNRTWGHLLQRWPAPATEFWTDAIAAVPNFVWIAEVYWDMEWRMQQLGFNFTYDKRLLDRLRASRPDEIRGHLFADAAYQAKSVRFLENHDEERSAAVFGRERIPSLALLVATLPGMRFFHQGQFEGRKIHIPMPLSRAAQEPVDQKLRDTYERVLRFAGADVFHRGEWKLLDVTSAGDDTFRDLLAYGWRHEKEMKIVIVNLGSRSAQGRVSDAAPPGFSAKCLYCDELDNQRYLWDRGAVHPDGLYVNLAPYGAHAFSVVEASAQAV